MKPRKMYLDIDGVIVVWDRTHNCVELARGYGRLMRFCKLQDIRPIWLTMWSRSREHLTGISRLLWPDICPTMATPEIVTFEGSLKAEAIDYNSDFVWIEDGLDERNIEVLRANGAEDRFFWTDGVDPDCLLKFMDFTREKMKLPPIEDWGPEWGSTFARPRSSSTRPG